MCTLGSKGTLHLEGPTGQRKERASSTLYYKSVRAAFNLMTVGACCPNETWETRLCMSHKAKR